MAKDIDFKAFFGPFNRWERLALFNSLADSGIVDDNIEFYSLISHISAELRDALF